MPGAATLILLTLLPFLASIITLFLPRNARNAGAGLAGAVTLCGALLAAMAYPALSDGGVLRYRAEWLPGLGVDFSLRMDGFAWLFTMLITLIGFLVVLYARYYMSSQDPVPRFFSFLLAFMGSMLGVVLSGNLIQLVVFWELTSVFSFLLIGYWHQNQAARDGARMALTVTAMGGLALLVGVLMLGHIAGSYDLDAVLAAGERIRGHRLFAPTLILILIGAFTKSAQVPFQFWLPQAMTAPTPVSAYLHSATMVKAGVFLLVRLWPVFASTELWFWIVTPVGMITLLLGAYVAIFQQDLKGLLAYSTISHLGLITALVGMGSQLGAVAAIFHIVNHATFKASLFMAAGIIDHETGTRDIRRLSGLFRFMPFTATLAMVASAAMAGVPLLNGFLSKEMFFHEAAAPNPNPFVDLALPFTATLAGMFAVVYSLRFIFGVFFGPPPTGLERVPKEPPALMRRPIELLVLSCLVVGIIPGVTIGPFLVTAVHSVLGPDMPPYSLAVWHGFTVPLLMSVIAMVGGIVIYLGLRRHFERGLEMTPLLGPLQGQRIFDRIMVTVSWRWARWLEAKLSSRRLQPQLRLVVAVSVLAALLPLSPGLGPLPFDIASADPVLALLWTVGIGCAIGAAHQAKYHRLVALVLMSGAGLMTCLTFVWFSAPDLALTQLLVEIVTMVLILLGMRWLPALKIETPDEVTLGLTMRRFRDLGMAVVAGAGMTAISYAVMVRDLPDRISQFFLENAYIQGGGHNVVNVILVDFRGFDTMGEITVLGVVAITVFALLRRFRPAADSIPKPEQQQQQRAFDEAHPDRKVGDTIHDYLLVPSVTMQWLFPVSILLAAHIFLRGHDQPGGGFAAGIVMSIGFILQYMASGTRWVEERLRILPVMWIASGLLMAAATGVGSLFFDYPFLTSAFQYAELPVIGRVPLATALLFDLGVFMLVVGATVLILIALAHQSIRNPKPARTVPPEIPVEPMAQGGDR